MTKIIAAFDFDGTLTRRDTSLAFLAWAAGWPRAAVAAGYAVLTAPFDWIRAHRCERTGKNNRVGAVRGWWEAFQHERMVSATIGGWSASEVANAGVRFAMEGVRPFIRPKALHRVQWHLDRGHEVVLVSASLDVYLVPWAREHGFHSVIATQLELRRDRVTGRFVGKPCWGLGKLDRLREYLGGMDGVELYAYGDSRGDLEVLQAAQHAFHGPLTGPS